MGEAFLFGILVNTGLLADNVFATDFYGFAFNEDLIYAVGKNDKRELLDNSNINKNEWSLIISMFFKERYVDSVISKAFK